LNEGEFGKLQKYILERALLPDGTPIFSARHFAAMIDEARKEFPMNPELFKALIGEPTKMGDLGNFDPQKVALWLLRWFGNK